METLELLKALYGCTSKKDIEELFLKDFKKCRSNKDLVKLHNKYLPYIWFGRAYNSIIKKYTELRSIIETASTSQSDDALEDVFIMGETQMRGKPFYDGLYNVSIKKATTKQIKKTDNDLIEIDLEKLKEVVSDLRKKIDYEIDNPKYEIGKNQTREQVKAYHLIILLALVTGRRQVEIMKSLEIDYNKRRKQQVYFKGIAKKGKVADDYKERGLILFIDPADAKKYLSMLRKILDVSELSNTQINQKYSGILTKALNRYTKGTLGINVAMYNNQVKELFEKLKEDETQINQKYSGEFTKALKRYVKDKLGDNKDVYSHQIKELYSFKGIEETQINQKYSGEFTKALKRYVKDTLGGMTMHDLRSLYSEYAWETKSDGYVNKEVFVSTVLNQKVSVTVASNYYKFKNKKQSEATDGNV